MTTNLGALVALVFFLLENFRANLRIAYGSYTLPYGDELLIASYLDDLGIQLK